MNDFKLSQSKGRKDLKMLRDGLINNLHLTISKLKEAIDSISGELEVKTLSLTQEYCWCVQIQQDNDQDIDWVACSNKVLLILIIGM